MVHFPEGSNVQAEPERMRLPLAVPAAIQHLVSPLKPGACAGAGRLILQKHDLKSANYLSALEYALATPLLHESNASCHILGVVPDGPRDQLERILQHDWDVVATAYSPPPWIKVLSYVLRGADCAQVSNQGGFPTGRDVGVTLERSKQLMRILAPSVSAQCLVEAESKAHAEILRVGFNCQSKRPTFAWRAAERQLLPPVLYDLITSCYEQHLPLGYWAGIYVPAIVTLGRVYRLCRENHDARILVLVDRHLAPQVRWHWGRHVTNKEVRALESESAELLIEQWEALGELVPDIVKKQLP